MIQGELIDSEIYYSYNKDTWTLLDSNGITLNNGDVVYMKSTLKKNNGYLTSVTKIWYTTFYYNR